MPSVILNDIEKIIIEISKFEDLDLKLNDFYKTMGQTPHKNHTELQTILIFDLVESTLLKSKLGHSEAMQKILLHDKICRTVVKTLSGEILKETGDGMVTLFSDPLNACLAAMNVLEITTRKHIPTKAVLALGMVEKIKISNKTDIFGTIADICSRIEKYASENQILINSSLHDTVITFLKNYDDVLISKPLAVTLKGYGDTILYEIATKKLGLKNHVKLPLNVEDRQLSINEKIEFIRNAKSSIIEMNEGLYDIARHLENSKLFKEFIKDLLRKRIHIKLIMEGLEHNLEETKKENNSIQKNHFMILREVQHESRIEKLSGVLEIYECEKPLPFNVTCIDSNQEDGMLLVSSNLPGVRKEIIPQVLISKTSQPFSFKSYMLSVEFLLTISKLQ